MALENPAARACGTERGVALLLEDDAALQAVLVDLLADEGLPYAACDSYAELRSAVANRAVSVIVADFWGASHLELTADERDEIRELAQRAPTILLTGRSWARPELADELDLVCLLTKPLDLDKVVAQVRHCLEVAQKSTPGRRDPKG